MGESFTKESVLITWDPPAEPNDDIELLTYYVYFHIHNFDEAEALLLMSQTRIKPGLGMRGQFMCQE